MQRHGFKSTSFSLMLMAALLLALIPNGVAHGAGGGIRYAKPSATGTGDCFSWANACTLQTALTGAISGNEIWVAAGTHKPTAAFLRTATFQLKNGVAVYGGFSGTETARSERNPVTNLTTLSGLLSVITGNSYHVVTGATGATLDGFTIRAGNADGDSPHNNGGGMTNTNSNPTLANIIFSGNSAKYGGGMYNISSSPTLTNVTFTSNTAQYGGGMYNSSGSSPILTNVTFSSNTATNYAGGGMCNEAGSSPTLTNVTFSGNSSDLGGNGGGMSSASSSNPILTNVTFSNNKATYGGGMSNINNSPTLTNVTFNGNHGGYGGGMQNYNGNPTMTNVTFSANSASESGGGINNLNSRPTLTNITFSGNSAAYGGGMRNFDSSPTLTNVTFSGNSAHNGGGMYNGITSGESTPQIRNSIFWGNTASISGPQIYNSGSSPYVSYSVLQAGCPEGSACTMPIIFTDPLLGTLGDYGGSTQTIPLLAGSSAIDVGSDTGCPATDQRGITRPQGAHCDIGAYEYDSLIVPPVVVVTASDGTSLDKVDVSWTASSGATVYAVYRSESVTMADPIGLTTTTLGGADFWAVPGVTYYYSVRACNGAICSASSVVESGWRGLTPPVVTASKGSDPAQVNVSWPASSGAMGYIAYRSDSPGGVKIPTGGISTTNLGGADTWAIPGITYYYWVKACSQLHCSDLSVVETGWR